VQRAQSKLNRKARKDKRKGGANRAIAGLKKANDIGLENVQGYTLEVIQRFDK